MGPAVRHTGMHAFGPAAAGSDDATLADAAGQIQKLRLLIRLLPHNPIAG